MPPKESDKKNQAGLAKYSGIICFLIFWLTYILWIALINLKKRALNLWVLKCLMHQHNKCDKNALAALEQND